MDGDLVGSHDFTAETIERNTARWSQSCMFVGFGPMPTLQEVTNRSCFGADVHEAVPIVITFQNREGSILGESKKNDLRRAKVFNAKSSKSTYQVSPNGDCITQLPTTTYRFVYL